MRDCSMGKWEAWRFSDNMPNIPAKSYFREYAEELLDEVFDMVHENIPINFVDGLCGIGWGVEHLIQNAFVGRRFGRCAGGHR